MTISEEGQKMIKIVFDHSFQIRGVNQYGTAVKILVMFGFTVILMNYRKS